MHLSKSTIYAIRAVLYLASLSDHSFVTISRISKKLDISYHYLTKILQILTEQGITESFRGSNGGVRLTKSADKVYLADIIDLVANRERLYCECPLGLRGCDSEHPCPMHSKWEAANHDIRHMVETLSVREFVKLKRLNPDSDF